MTHTAYPNYVREALASRRFVLTIEVATPRATEPFEDAIRSMLVLAREIRDDPRIDAIAVTDRSRSDHDHDPIVTGARMAEVCGKMPIVHWAGKDRTLSNLETDLERAEALGLDTFLLVTGDKVHHPPADRPVRYLDSVNALDTARQRSPKCLLAAAVCPFKYREEELVNQYLKAGKKLRAGADFLMTQIGWDPLKFAEVHWFLNRRGYHAPLLAELLLLTAPRSRRIRSFGLPGVTITDDLAQRLEEEAASPDGGRAAAFRRLALQIVTVRDLGYAGAQISGLVRYPSIVRLLDEIDAITRQHPTPEARQEAWQELLTLKEGRTVQVAPTGGLYLQASAVVETMGRPVVGAASSPEWSRFRTMDLIDRLLFREGSIGAELLGPLLRRLDPRSGVGEVLLRAERAIKEPLVGCQTCGFCRLPHTAYVCPETCPKGLANGPCGGTKDNTCEFGDRECIHNQIYRISKQTGGLSNLEEVLMPSVPEPAWDSCSWITHFRGAGPKITRLMSPGEGK